MANDHQATVREIIAENHYMTVATTDGEQPWLLAGPVLRR